MKPKASKIFGKTPAFEPSKSDLIHSDVKKEDLKKYIKLAKQEIAEWQKFLDDCREKLRS